MSTPEEKPASPPAADEAAAAPPKEETKEASAPKAASSDDKPKEEESTATFEPVVKLEEVEVKSGEEEEEVIHDVRAKCFIFGETLLDKGTGNKTWRERGIGQARILRHREHSRLRILMRQEKTMKVVINHAIDPRIILQPNAGSDRSWVWSAFDFAEGELLETVFALRFSDSDVAAEFRTAFLAAQKEMEGLLAGEDKEDEDGAAEEAAEALGALKTKDDDEEKDEGKE